MLEAMFTRIENAHEDFIETLMTWGEISKAEAVMVKNLYLKNRAAKLDTGIGRISVKHGVYLEKDVIQDAVKEAKRRAFGREASVVPATIRHDLKLSTAPTLPPVPGCWKEAAK